MARKLEDILKSSKQVCDLATHVKINNKMLLNFVDKIKPKELEEETKDSSVNQKAGNDRLEKSELYFAYNAVNFSFFPDKGDKNWFIIENDEFIGKDDEAHAIVASLSKYQKNNPGALSNAKHLLKMTINDLEAIFAPAEGAGKLPLLDLRLKCLHCLGKGYEKLVGCKEVNPFLELFNLCGDSLDRFIDLVVEYFDVFDDKTVYKSEIKIGFYKRVQLLASMLHSEGIVVFKDIFKLTVFADYKIPQLFLFEGVFEYSESLLKRIDEQQMLEKGCSEEIEIRAATIVAAEEIKSILLKSKGVKVKSCTLDYYLWRTAVEVSNKESGVRPFHRVRSIFY